jgi:hypothetical protein
MVWSFDDSPRQSATHPDNPPNQPAVPTPREVSEWGWGSVLRSFALGTPSASSLARSSGLSLEGQIGSVSTYRSYPCLRTSALGFPLEMVQLYAEAARPQKIVFTFASLSPPCSIPQPTSKEIEKKSSAIFEKLRAIYGPPQWASSPEKLGINDTLRTWNTGWGRVYLHNVQGNLVSVEVTIPTRPVSSNSTKVKIHPPRRRDNNDIILETIPMMDQGDRGFCSPATIERVMRYYGIDDVSMDTLAVKAETGRVENGTLREDFMAVLSRISRAYHLRLEIFDKSDIMKQIYRSIDRGVPVIWNMATSQQIEDYVKKYNLSRTSAASTPARLPPTTLKQLASAGQGHTRLIVGYNAKSGEIAVSDSWGPGAECRWIPGEFVLGLSLERESLMTLSPR